MTHVGYVDQQKKASGTRALPLALFAVLVSLFVAAPAFAGDIALNMELRSGSLSLVAPQVAATSGKSLQIPITIADGRGTGAGWTLQLAALKNVTITSITARCAPGSTCTLPRSVGASGATILKVARDSGMGVMQLVITVAPLAHGSAGVPLAFTVS